MATPKRKGAGALSELCHFQVRPALDDGYGNPITGPWTTQFTEPCRMVVRTGSEPVIAARLTGVQPFTLVVRYSSRTAAVTPAWRAVNARTGVTYNIATVVNVDERRTYLEMLVTAGVATG